MINPTDAPEGYEAVETVDYMSCEGCEVKESNAYWRLDACKIHNCVAPLRADNEDVIFKLITHPPQQTIE